MKRYFDKNEGFLKRFPHCINVSSLEMDETVNWNDLKTTMFVCDLEPGKRVGNGNDDKTTGGVFGQWVPMHYTAAYIDKQQAVKYTEASAAKIASLIEAVVVSTNVSLHENTDTSETKETDSNETKIDILKLATSHSERQKLVNTMNKIYNTGYGPPEWVGEKYVAKKTFDLYAKNGFLFYDREADVAEVKKVAKEREPVNITMERYFNGELMEKAFGYRKSYYQRYYDDNEWLAPNIGVLTRSMIRIPNKTDKDKYTERQMNIYHAIGAALDHKDQPDYKVFIGQGNTDVDGLKEFYVSVFMKIFHAAASFDAPGIVMSLVGAEAFASLYPGQKGKMQTDVWIPAFKFVLEYTTRILAREKKSAMGLALMCDKKKSGKDPAYEYMTETVNANDVGLFPDFLESNEDYGKYKDWILVNAWDCHTIPGNGNEKDPTLDGRIGRISEIQYIGWGEANPALLTKNNMYKTYVPWFDHYEEEDASSTIPTKTKVAKPKKRKAIDSKKK